MEVLSSPIDVESPKKRFGQVAALEVKEISSQSKLLRRSSGIHELLWSDLRIEKIIGIGGFSTVYRAQTNHPELKLKSYALKCLNKDTMEDEERLYVGAKDLAGEAEVLARLQHKNIIELHGIYAGGPLNSFLESERGYFILLDLLEKATLQDKLTLYRRKLKQKSLRKHSKLAGLAEMMQGVVIGVANGLAYLHSQNVVLRDLKPNNIGFDVNGTPKLYDFGFAREVHTVDKLECCGSLRYMAPEIAQGLGTTLKSDVYSYGILLWELYTLKKPFNDTSDPEIFKEMVFIQGTRPSLKSIQSKELKELLQECWDSQPLIRPSMEEVVNIIQNTVTMSRHKAHHRTGLWNSNRVRDDSALQKARRDGPSVRMIRKAAEAGSEAIPEKGSNKLRMKSFKNTLAFMFRCWRTKRTKTARRSLDNTRVDRNALHQPSTPTRSAEKVWISQSEEWADKSASVSWDASLSIAQGMDPSLI
jgi:serine/threonine protein kinase